MSTLNVNTINPVQANESLNFQTGGTTFVQLTTAGVLSGNTTGSIYAPGMVLQVVSVSDDTHYTWTADAITTLIEVDITPTSATSKMLVRLHGWMGEVNPNGSMQLIREVDSSDTHVGGTTRDIPNVAADDGGFFNADDSAMINNDYAVQMLGWEYLDSPATTSAITYRIQAHGGGDNSPNTGWEVMYWNRSKGTTNGDMYATGNSTLTVMEIAG